MVKLRNVSPLGDLVVPSLGGVVVQAGDVVDVPQSIAGPLLEQTDTWQRVPTGDTAPTTTPEEG